MRYCPFKADKEGRKVPHKIENTRIMSFKITILGSASAKPTTNRHPSGQVVSIHEQYYLVDAGEGVQQQLIRYGVNPLKIREVFIIIE